ncbi:putative neutral sphingomyelinase isoform X2 [Hydractinia symbiolongicarpus]|nr:putative neutral sphingomyelinase isoform X2 [Hydractinia symbiolongicarpus]XP_057313048.1 putative neutral sphingomyelinase isoform X2 [Hydractinia symbiolongicarpus]XP_057313049.1 putative neutral sphingomyelinase isoform X2 [Hydractinia symbiolongicarpus]
MDELKVLTLNTWGLLYISKNIEERMNALANKLAEGNYDIVALQEVFSIRIYERICEQVKDALPYSHYFHSGFLGSGCATFSKYPIIDTYFHKYLHNGYFWDFTHGDWYAGKGIGCTLIKHPKKTIYCLNTHLHASYGASDFTECRSLQAYQITQLLRHTTRPDDAVIICGDFNHEPDELGIKVLLGLTDLKDTYAIAKEKPDECITSSNLNPYNDHSDTPSRIDYIFVNNDFDCSSCSLTFQEIPGTDMRYSDHEGYTTTLRFKQDKDDVPVKTDEQCEILSKLSQVIKTGEKMSKRITWSRFFMVLFFFVVFNAIPVLLGEMFPTCGSWIGKCLFIVQLFVIVVSVVYFVMVVVVTRQIHERDFKNVFKEIDLRLKVLRGFDNKKFD